MPRSADHTEDRGIVTFHMDREYREKLCMIGAQEGSNPGIPEPAQ